MTVEDPLDQAIDISIDRRKFLAGMRHELRTPINHIIGYGEMLQEEAGDQGQKGFVPDLQRIQEAGRQLLTLVNNNLDAAKIETGKISISRLRHELRTPLNTIIGYSEMLQEDAQVQGQGGFIPGLQNISGAARQMLAFINDSLTYSEIEASEIGLEEANPVTRAMVSDLGDAILPLEDGQRSRTGSGSLLVVDDNAMNRDMLSRRLERQGHMVALAENGRKALEMVKNNNYELVLLDVMMPEMNGYQVLERLKADDASRHIPVIMLSALDEIESVVRCIEMGAEDYLPKPFNPVLLKARTGACLEKKRLHDQEVFYLQQIEMEKKRAD